jgi:5-methylcytosine-specific restriction endonuclease McrA
MLTDNQSLQSMSLMLLDSHIKKLVSSERNITDQILKAITELDVRRGYAELGFSSLFSYLTCGVGYSESAAQRRIASARLMAKVSQPVQAILRTKLQDGGLNLSQVSKLGSMLQTIEKATENKAKLNVTDSSASTSIAIASDVANPNSNAITSRPITADAFIENLLPKIERKDSVKTESAIFSTAQDLFPHLNLEVSKPEPKAKIKQGASGKVTITLTLSAEQNEKLKKVLAKKSHAIPNGDINKLFEKLLDKELKDYDVKTKPDSTSKKLIASGREATFESATDSASSYTTEAAVASMKSQTTRHKKQTKKRKYISVKIKRRVFAKANHQCQYLSPVNGERCKEQNFLTIDHIQPVALGGTDDQSNYRCLCKSHNLAEARRMGIAAEYQFTTAP